MERREEIGRAASQQVTRFDADFGRTVEPSLVLHSIGGRRLTVQDLEEHRGQLLKMLGVASSGKQAGLDKRLFGAGVSGGDELDGQ